MEISKTESQVLRGLGILLIVMHNMCHFFNHAIAENEYTWSVDRILYYCKYVAQGGPHLLLNLFSHYGHYGIVVFLFLSGYGLTRKYEKADRISFVPFMLNHALKLWKMIAVGLVMVILVQLTVGHVVISVGYVVKLLTFTANLFPTSSYVFGPWWWFGLMMQFYAVYLVFCHRRRLRIILLVTLICLIAQYAITIYDIDCLAKIRTLLFTFRHNFPSVILPFTLGVFAARCRAGWLYSPYLFVLSLAMVVLGSFSVWVWDVAVLFACIALLQVGKWMNLVSWIQKPMAWIGMISAWIFVVHPIVRHLVFYLIGYDEEYLTLSVYLLFTIVVSYALHLLMSKVKTPQLKIE